LHIPLDPKIKELRETPYTISFVIRKLIQIDNLRELPKEKQPPDKMIWEGTSEDIEEWLDEVMKNIGTDKVEFSLAEIEH
jgi:hypothetical protein